jgi:hypothetical protein
MPQEKETHLQTNKPQEAAADSGLKISPTNSLDSAHESKPFLVRELP